MNPYEVLGVPEGADIETVKKAYKELVKKYHPDKYVNNPLADLASEKLKEINKAYDMIMNGNSTSGNNSYAGGGYQSANTNDVSYRTVRQLLNMRRLMEAEAMLQKLPQNAEWNYLMGLLYIQKGWYDAGLNYIRTAAGMDPSNLEYMATLNRFQNRNTAYRQYGAPTNSIGGCGNMDCCTQLCLADCCCECMGGDLIPCC